MIRKIWIAAIVAITAAGCYNDKYDKLYPTPPASVVTATCDTDTTISYSKVIYPIIQANCMTPGQGCHDAVGSGKSGYNYEVFAVFDSNAVKGWVVQDINFMPIRGHSSMPLNGTPLPSCDINEITRWVNEGAPEN